MLKGKLGDICLSTSIVIQQLLAVVQLFLGDTLILSIESAASFRVMSTAFFVLLSFLWIVKRSRLQFIISYLIIGILFLWTLFLSPDSIKFIKDEGVKFTCLVCIPVFLATLSVRNIKTFHDIFYVLCILTAFVGILYGVLMFAGIILQEHYNMAFGYSLMLPVLYLIYKKTLFSLTLSVLTASSLLLNGSRGPFLIIVAYLMWLFIHYMNLKRVIVLLVLMSFAVLMVSYLEVILSFLSDHSIQSRVLKRILENEMSDPSGRESIYEFGVRKIFESPVAGYGLFGDRFFYESYVHNIFLEMLIDFGIPIGILVICFLSFVSLLKFFSLKGREKDFFVLAVMGSVFPLFASGSYLISFSFFFYLGLLMRKHLIPNVLD